MYTSDRDGKSKTASAVDSDHYPEQNETSNDRFESDVRPAHHQIAERAFNLWTARNGVGGSAEQDWLQAEYELQDEGRAKTASRNVTTGSADKAGSVQR